MSPRSRAETLSEAEIEALLSALSTTENPMTVDFWQDRKRVPILISPSFFSSSDMDEFGWPFLFFWKLGSFEPVITEELLIEYQRELEKCDEKNESLVQTFQYFFNFSISRLKSEFVLIDYGKLIKGENKPFEDLVSKVKGQVCIVHPSSEKRECFPWARHIVPFPVLIKQVFSDNPIYRKKIRL